MIGSETKKRGGTSVNKTHITSSASTTYTAPNIGLESCLFTISTSKSAAIFEETLEKLARHMGIQPWQGTTVVSRAIGDLIDPTTLELVQPVKGECYKDAAWISNVITALIGGRTGMISSVLGLVALLLSRLMRTDTAVALGIMLVP